VPARRAYGKYRVATETNFAWQFPDGNLAIETKE
jgi:hypothetical protein